MERAGLIRLQIRGGILAAFLAITNVVADAPTSTEHTLDGLRFKGLTGEQGKGDDHSDTIVFQNGQFRSLDCESWGFGPAPYNVVKDGDSYIFTAILRSAKRGTLSWKGTITGDTATATFHWQHERWYWDIDRHYWFEGTRHD